MSSRVREPEDTSGVEPLVWRQMHASGPARTGVDTKERAKLPRATRAVAAAVRATHARSSRRRGARGRSGRTPTGGAPNCNRSSTGWRGRSTKSAVCASRLRAEAEADLVQLSLAIARRVLRRELAIDPEALHGLILGALEKLSGQEISRVRVHPGARGAGYREPAPEQQLGQSPSDRRCVARIGHGDLRDAARQSRCLGGIATSGDRAGPGRPPAEEYMSISLSPPISPSWTVSRRSAGPAR